jgi:hypothetical protein
MLLPYSKEKVTQQTTLSTATGIDEDPRSGRLSTSTYDVHIDAVHDLIRQNRRLTITEIAEDVGVSFGSCQAILTEKLSMHRVAVKFVPRGLTGDQKANRVKNQSRTA